MKKQKDSDTKLLDIMMQLANNQSSIQHMIESTNKRVDQLFELVLEILSQ